MPGPRDWHPETSGDDCASSPLHRGSPRDPINSTFALRPRLFDDRALRDLSADDWAALSKSDVVDRWLTRTIKGFDVSELANKEIAKLRAFKQGSMTTEIYEGRPRALRRGPSWRARLARC